MHNVFILQITMRCRFEMFARHNLFLLLIASLIYVGEVLASSEEDEMQPCIDLLTAENAEDCCESLKILKSWDDAMDGCTKKTVEDLNCDDYNCMLNKLGIMENRKVDETSAKQYFTSLAESFPDQVRLIDYLGVTCFDGKHDHYDFMEESCPAINFYTCSYTNILLECDSWSKSDECKKMSENSKACKSILNN